MPMVTGTRPGSSGATPEDEDENMTSKNKVAQSHLQNSAFERDFAAVEGRF